jgi:hypothetical protein
MSSKTPPTLPDVLDKLLHRFQYTFAPDGTIKPDEYVTLDFIQAKQAIITAVRQFVVDIIGQDEEVKIEYIRTHTGEVLGPMTDDIVTPQLNNLRAEQRKQLLAALGEGE